MALPTALKGPWHPFAEKPGFGCSRLRQKAGFAANLARLLAKAATTAKVFYKGPWNPFRVTGTPMPPNLLLMCKILAVAILATGHYRILPDPFLPFIPMLDQLTDPQTFRTTLQTVAVVAAIALLFNRSVRFSALVLGSCMLLGVVSSRAYYGNNKTFVGLALVLTGLSDFDRPAYLLRWQLALVYFGAALNKFLDPDWQSGLFFHYWAGTKLKNPVYLELAPLLPDLLAGKIMCWGTAVAEIFISVGVLIPPLVPLALWVNAVFQVGLLEFTGGTFTLFFYAMNAVALAFITWPQRIAVFSNQSSGWRWLRWFDPDGLQDWRTWSEGDESASRVELQKSTSLAVQDGPRVYMGIAASCRLLLYSPVFWLLGTALLAVATTNLWRRLLVAGVVLLVLVAFIGKKNSQATNG